MLISVVIPTYNRAVSLRDTLAAATAQAEISHEVVVVDDGSKDDTAGVVQGFPLVRYVRQDNRGPAAARNTGAKVAQGDVLAFTDDDCVPPATWLKQLAEGYQRYPTVAGVGGPCRAPAEYLAHNRYAQYEWRYERAMLPPVGYIQWLTHGHLNWQNQWPGKGDYLGGMDCPVGRSNNVSYRREMFLALNGFDETFPLAAGEDTDFKIRLCLAGHQLLWLDSLVVEHRHAYNARRFRTQHYTYGRGVVCLERKYRDQPTPRWRAVLRLCKRALRLPLAILPRGTRDLTWLRFQAEMYDALGQMVR